MQPRSMDYLVLRRQRALRGDLELAEWAAALDSQPFIDTGTVKVMDTIRRIALQRTANGTTLALGWGMGSPQVISLFQLSEERGQHGRVCRANTNTNR